jgi:hypothetical protein
MSEKNEDKDVSNQDIMAVNIRNKIQYKKAYYANQVTASNIQTDMSKFPYQRWYRGVAESDHPVIMEREAGYRILQKEPLSKKEESEYPKHVFAAACSTVLPIYSKEGLKKETAGQFCAGKFL